MMENKNSRPEVLTAEESFAEALRAARGRQSQTAVAQRMGYSGSHYSNVENGHKPPTLDFARACDLVFDTAGRFVALFEASTVEPSRKLPVRPAQLPPSPHVVGREGMFRALDDLLGESRDSASATVVALDGQAGVGKTTLAVAWAHRIKDRYPDGVLFVDLHGYTADGSQATPSEVLEDLLKVLGVPAAEIPATLDWRAALLRTVLDGTRTLLVLDNAARIEQVRPLIPAAPGCLVVVTSRQRLSGLAVQYGARCLSVEVFAQEDSVKLLREVVGASRVDGERLAAERITRFCGGLPLAVRIAAERVAASCHLTLAGLADDLSRVDQRLDILSPQDTDGTVRAVLSWSYRALEPAAAKLFRLLALHPGREFGVDAAAVLSEASRAETVRWIDTLTTMHLLHETQHQRYRFHDLVRDYAAERVVAEESLSGTADASRRLLSWYLHTMAAANARMSPKRPQVRLGDRAASPMPSPKAFGSADEALVWCETELTNLAAVTEHAAGLGIHDVAFGLPMVLADYLYWRRPWRLWIGPLERCLAEARRCGDRPAQAWILNNLGNAHLAQHRPSDAERCFSEALELRKQDGDLLGQLWSLVGIGRVLQARGVHEDAKLLYAQAWRLCAEQDDEWLRAIVTSYLADARRAVGEPLAALDLLREAVGILRRHGDRQSESCALDKMSDAFRDLGEEAASLDHLREALVASEAAADRWGRAEFLRKLGHRYLELHDREQARQAWTDALHLFEALGDARAKSIRAELDALDQAVPAPRRAG